MTRRHPATTADRIHQSITRQLAQATPAASWWALDIAVTRAHQMAAAADDDSLSPAQAAQALILAGGGLFVLAAIDSALKHSPADQPPSVSPTTPEGDPR